MIYLLTWHSPACASTPSLALSSLAPPNAISACISCHGAPEETKQYLGQKFRPFVFLFFFPSCALLGVVADSGAKMKVPWLVASTDEVMNVAGQDVRGGGQLENYVARFQVCPCPI